ncbi:MAG: hypothetical protein PQJ47_09890 [Sphaerochaetaceae bacterium]|nr:hypothetical protein [Sphaerochaetaceae bacterium]
MVDTAYQAGLDWDTYRVQPVQYKSASNQMQDTSGENVDISTNMKIILCITGVVILLLFSYYVLLNIPYFDIDAVTYLSANDQPLPPSIEQTYHKEIIGTSVFSFPQRKIRRALESHPLVRQVRFSRFGRELEVVVDTAEVSIIIEEGNGAYAALADSTYIPLDADDFRFLSSQIPRVESVQADEQQMQLIGRILEDSSGDSFNDGMILPASLYFPSMDIRIDIRESVSLYRLKSVVRLVTLQYEKNRLSNIALNSKVRYDLYQEALFKEQIFGGNN